MVLALLRSSGAAAGMAEIVRPTDHLLRREAAT